MKFYWFETTENFRGVSRVFQGNFKEVEMVLKVF